MLGTAIRYLLFGLLWIVVILGLAATIVPRFLDRRYYEGPESDHFDGERFFNPDGEDTVRLPGGGSRAGFFWRQMTGRDGRPAWPKSVAVSPARPADLLQPYLASIQYVPASAEQEAATPMVATWVGHASVLVQTPNINILTDPIWSDTAGPFGFGPSRVTAPGIRFDDLPKVDLVLLSHNHYDHLDLATLKRLWDRDKPLIVTPLGNDAILRSHGIGATAVDWGGRVTLEERAGVGAGTYSTKPVEVIVTRNHHWGSRWFSDRNRALWSSFVVTLPGGNLFFAGDTGFGDGRWPAEAAAYGPIRLALIPIGAFRFQAGQMTTGSHIGPVDAVEVFRRLSAQTAIPIHWGTFRLSYEGRMTPPGLLTAAFECSNAFAAVEIGRPTNIAPIATVARAPGLVPVSERDREAVLRCLDTDAVRGLR
jgi:L-ascorbate metabolism protein UlaG (beta-lactamase superfamily)